MFTGLIPWSPFTIALDVLSARCVKVNRPLWVMRSAFVTTPQTASSLPEGLGVLDDALVALAGQLLVQMRALKAHPKHPLLSLHLQDSKQPLRPYSSVCSGVKGGASIVAGLQRGGPPYPHL